MPSKSAKKTVPFSFKNIIECFRVREEKCDTSIHLIKPCLKGFVRNKNRDKMIKDSTVK